MTLAQIGRFQVERALGSGSFATVWLARDPDLDAWVAIKLLAENWSLNEDARRRFMEEAKALRLLDSERIVRVYEVGKVSDGRPYMVMEYADRGTLEDRMRLRAQLDQSFSVEEAVALSLDIADCMIAVHDLRIVHRDVKPSNVLFRAVSPERQQALHREGKPVQAERTLLGDFGIARRLEGVLGHTLVLGSPQYMAPEQADPDRAATVDYRSDVYSAAVILYELLAGRVPTSQPAPGQEHGQSSRPADIRSARADVPARLGAVIARGLAREPNERFASAWEWKEAVRSAAQERDSVAVTARAPAAVGSTATPTLPTSPPGRERIATVPVGPRTATRPLPARPDDLPAPAPPSVPTAGALREGLRMPAVALMAAALGCLIGILMPWASAVSRSGGDVRHRFGVVFRGGGVVLMCGLVLFWASTRLWRTARRWVATVASLAASAASAVSFGVLLYELAMIQDNVAVTLPGGGASWNVRYGAGLGVVFGAAVVGSLAGISALRRLLRARRRERHPLLRT